MMDQQRQKINKETLALRNDTASNELDKSVQNCPAKSMEGKHSFQVYLEQAFSLEQIMLDHKRSQ